MIDIDELIEAVRKSLSYDEWGACKMDADDFLQELYYIKASKESAENT